MTDRLDDLLRADALQALADDGFSARVMRALPPPPSPVRPWVKPVLVLGSTALGSALALAFAPAGINVLQGFADLALMRGLTTAAMFALGVGFAMVASAVVLATE